METIDKYLAAQQYDKYIYSTKTHYISNSGADERGKYKGGQAGDQTGNEWSLKEWYSRPWNYMHRYEKDERFGLLMAKLSCAAALNNKIGYDQNQRLTYWQQLEKVKYDPALITVGCEDDCSSGVNGNIKAIGYLLDIDELKNISITTTHYMPSTLKKAGFTEYRASKYLTSGNYLLPGDVLLLSPGHTCTNISYGKYSANEKQELNKESELGTRILKNGSVGRDVVELQTNLINLGYDCGRWGADGDFGDATEFAVELFQKDHNCDIDGEYGPKTHNVMMNILKAQQEATQQQYYYVLMSGGDSYIRMGPTTTAGKLGVAKKGDKLPFTGKTASNGWYAVNYQGYQGWISNKYSKLVK